MTKRQLKVFNARLIKVAELLEGLKKAQFRFNHYVGEDWQGKPDLSCGTTACAFGWATTIPSLRRLGLRLVPGNTFDTGYPALKEHLNSLSYIGEEAIDLAAAKIFGLTAEETAFLFIPGDVHRGYSGLDCDATAKQVAKHIRKFVKTRTLKQEAV